MKNFTIENETNNITAHGSAKEAEPSLIPSDSAPKPRWRSWRRTGPQPDWSTSGTVCRVPHQ